MEHMETRARETKAEATGHFHDQKQKEFLIMQRSLAQRGPTFKYFNVHLPESSQKCLCACVGVNAPLCFW